MHIPFFSRLLHRSNRTRAAVEPIRGVNLGGWLILEKWMTPSLFRGLATDEYTLLERSDQAVRDQIKHHHDTYITRNDFVWLKRHGITAVRLPVGYWVFGDTDPYLPTIDYVDQAFQWAEENGIRILLDMHAAPGSQNGHGHSGRAGAVTWQNSQANIITTLQTIQKLAKRYGDSPALLGIELLNEPSNEIPRRVLKRYYASAYKIIRAECGETPWIVFSDSFKPRRWKRVLRDPEYKNVYIDTHQYRIFNRSDKEMSASEHIAWTISHLPRRLAAIARHHPTIVGEWSMALASEVAQGMTPYELQAVRRGYGAAQLLAYERTAGWFFWSYKLENGGPWSYRDCVEQGLLPGANYKKRPGNTRAAIPKK